jgi:hypothetical protein
MTAPTKLNLKMYQGSTFREVLRWESATKVYVPITGITKTAPMVVTAATHLTPPNWRVKISGVVGMKEVNSTEYSIASAVDTNTITFNQVNATGYTTYVSGGILEYNQPVDLTGFTARMQIREKLTSDAVIVELTTANNKIIIDNTLKTISFVLTAQETAALTFSTAVYSLELVSSGGEVSQLLTGTISLIKEVTR